MNLEPLTHAASAGQLGESLYELLFTWWTDGRRCNPADLANLPVSLHTWAFYSCSERYQSNCWHLSWRRRRRLRVWGSTEAVGGYVIGTRISISEWSGGLVCVCLCVSVHLLFMCEAWCRTVGGVRGTWAAGNWCWTLQSEQTGTAFGRKATGELNTFLLPVQLKTWRKPS